jgi:hypothetical protein
MAVNPIDNSVIATDTSEAQFNAAVEKSEAELSDDALNEQLITGAIKIGGQFIIMPMANNILNEAMSGEDDE